jgi:hypothetical protein
MNSIFDKEFYEKVVVIAKNASLITERSGHLEHDIYNIHINAVKCFFLKQYWATVFLSSIGVERYLNKVLKQKGWCYLNAKSIMKAAKAGIPVTELLDEFEKNPFQKGERIEPLFCKRRKKVLHGDFEGLAEIGAPEIEHLKARAIYVGTGIEKDAKAFVINSLPSAYDQLLKFQKFLLKV